MGFTHSWNGTVLTITSDSGTSSADLQGPVGDTGPRGPQGVGGDGSGVNLSDYYTKSEVDAAIAEIADVDTSTLATKEYVSSAIASAQLEGAEVDLSGYYTKSETDEAIADAMPNLNNYYTKTQIDALIDDIEIPATDSEEPVNLDGYYTKEEVDAAIAEAQLEGAGVDMSAYYTKTEIAALGHLTEAEVLALIEANIPTYADGNEVSY